MSGDRREREDGAAAAIMARLWGALAREPIPGLARRRAQRQTLCLEFDDGTVLSGDAAIARPFVRAAAGLSIAFADRELTRPGELVRVLKSVLGRHADRLATELDNSVANLALARAAQPNPDGGAPMLDRAAAQPDPLVFLEQSVVDGHPLHPCARTRVGLDPDQVRAYAPEHRPPPVRLRIVAVPPERWYGSLRPALLMHPWQHDRLREHYPWLSTVEGELPAHPLMSLRTLASVRDPEHHVKTAVEIQMTSAVRTVSPDSIHNGRTLSGLLEQNAMPGLEVLVESGGGAAIVDGEPDRRLAIVHRRMPPLAEGEIAFPLAALTARSAATGEPIVLEWVRAGDPLAFVSDLATVVLPPVLGWLERGVALEAHGQNLLGVVRDGRLVRVLYRDFGGVRVSARRLREHGIEPPELRGDVLSDDPEILRTKVLASAVSTVLGEVIAVLGRAGLDEEKAWHGVAAVARTLPGAAEAGLFDETLPVKAMTAMRLADWGIEDLWCALPNPMAGLR